MMRLALILFVGSILGVQEEEQEEGRFTTLEVYIETGKTPLAAYQVEITCDPNLAMIAGVSGGEPASFKKAPYYDPAALHGENRIVIASFTTDENPPSGKVLVATITMYETGKGAPKYESKVIVAARPGGKRFDAKIELIQKGENK